MTPKMQLVIKVIVGTMLVISLIIGLLERRNQPGYLMLEQSRSFPSWVGWLGWILAALATLAYVLADFVEW